MQVIKARANHKVLLYGSSVTIRPQMPFETELWRQCGPLFFGIGLNRPLFISNDLYHA